jgi:hypothetical protein
MKDQPENIPAQPDPASSKYPQRENLFQFLLRVGANQPHSVSGLLSEAPPFVMQRRDTGEIILTVDHYD